ncbi:hypothetical protein RSSM_03023 [Rhodopirellula sallentina SM41]|uniref:Uncharacterized protein n=1 Tax=Rhodopirellula sallentina SM41 TaxID=1263870 RepID=M5UHQ8_9BACT|nr:hypothetical protein RSSM_03023 [Rhodopirellula sallentina SM41]
MRNQQDAAPSKHNRDEPSATAHLDNVNWESATQTRQPSTQH